MHRAVSAARRLDPADSFGPLQGTEFVRKADNRYELTAKAIERLLGRIEPKIRKGFLEAMARAKKQNTLDEIADLIQAGRIQQAIDAVARAAAVSLADVANQALVDAGRQLAQAMTKAFGVSVTFDTVNVRAVGRMQQSQLRMIREFMASQRGATREALVDGIRRGLNPREQARGFRDSIGLTQRQQAAVSNYRRLLERGSTEALTRALRDKRFDSTVRAAIAGDKALTGEQIGRMVGRYQERYLKYRSEVIARTEALRAVHEGTEETIQQGIEDGLIDPGGTERQWVTAHDDRVRDPAHTAMDGQLRPIGTPFTSGNGNSLRFPGDPDAPASEIIQCRCVVTTRITRITT